VTAHLPLLCLALAAGTAHADAALGRAQAAAVALATQAAQAVAEAGAQVSVQAGALDARLALAPCDRIDTFLPGGTPAWGKGRVGLRCTSGPVRWQAWLPVTVQVLAPALVARGVLSAGTRLEAAHFATAEVDWAAAPGTPLASLADIEQRLLARPLRAGQAPRAADLRTRQWFAAGETVQIVARGNGFAIGGEGVALDAGLQGQPARVRTANGRVLSVQPVAERRVELVL
jgi:flagellar basal body P-ring formation protein FlgA